MEQERKKNLEEQQRTLRKYLLGTLSDREKMRQIEERLLLDEGFAEEISIAEEELIDEYLDGALGDGERKQFIQHFLASPERKVHLRLSQNLRKYAAKAEIQTTGKIPKEKVGFHNWRSLFSSPAIRFAAIALVVCGLVFAVWRIAFYQSDIDKGLAQLRTAYQGQRPVVPRTTANFDYVPLSDTRGTSTVTDARAKMRAEGFLLNATENSSDPKAHQALGLLYLADKKPDGALEEFNLALNSAPRDARLRNDIGAALFEKANQAEAEGKYDESMINKTKSLNSFDHALEIDDSLLEALFNRALVLQKMELSNQAQDAWRKYLEKDSTSPWAEEARQNLKILESNRSENKTDQQILQDFFAAYQKRDDDEAYQIVSRNREMITGKLIPQQLVFLFLDAENGSQNEFLSALVYIGELEKKRSGDAYFLDIAKFYSSLTGAELSVLREAKNSLQNGYEQIRQNNHQNALDEFSRARELFEKSENIWEARFCDYWIGYSLNRLNQIEKSTQVLLDLADFCEKNEYKWLASHAFGWLANNMVTSKEMSKAIEYNRKAILSSEQVFDLFNTQKSLLQQADVYRRVGDYNQALIFAQKGLYLSALPESSKRQKWRDFYAVSGIFLAMKLYDAAITYRKESLILAEEQRVDTFVYATYIDLGLIYGAQGKYEEAFDSFNQGRKVAEDFTDEQLKKKSNAYADLQTAHVQRQSKNCLEALKSYEKALSFYDTGEFQVNRYEARKGRLLCYSDTKNDPAFEAELPIILGLFRDYRTKILEEQNRNSFFDNEQSVYDIAINYEFEKQNYESAFDYSEESRSRSLLDMQNSYIEISNKDSNPEIKFSHVAAEPLKFSQIRAAIPENVQIVQYAVLGDKTLIWLIKKEELSVYKTDISAKVLEEKASAFLALLSKSNNAEADEQRQLAIELYQTLISPIEEKLDRQKQICLIPDKLLFHLPFAAFISPAEDKFFIAKYSFLMSPSANIFLSSTKKAQELNTNTDEKLLGIGNPSFNRENFADLSNLASAEKEVKEISQFYKNPILLNRKDASKEIVKDNLPKADVVHFAGHYVADKKNPLLSGLILAENAQTRQRNDSILANYEIIGEKLSNTKLIVLSACETGVERFYKGEGMIGASRTFLATGVPVIVASQWKVDSDSTAELMIRFHRYRKLEKLSTPAALRLAQIDLLEGENTRYRNPYHWAAFIAFGGYSEF